MNLLGPKLGTMGPVETDTQLAESMVIPSKVIKIGLEAVVVTTTSERSHTGRIVEQTANGKSEFRQLARYQCHVQHDFRADPD